METIKPVFKNLVMTDLLERCVGGYSQNNNESLNSKIWKICPKTGFLGRKTVQIAVSDAIITFNDGMKARLKVLEKLELDVGNYCQQMIQDQDKTRVLSANKWTLESTKEARKCRKRLRLEEEGRKCQQEGVVYAAGEF